MFTLGRDTIRTCFHRDDRLRLSFRLSVVYGKLLAARLIEFVVPISKICVHLSVSIDQLGCLICIGAEH